MLEREEYGVLTFGECKVQQIGKDNESGTARKGWTRWWSHKMSVVDLNKTGLRWRVGSGQKRTFWMESGIF